MSARTDAAFVVFARLAARFTLRATAATRDAKPHRAPRTSAPAPKA
jgi:hypothetical protein